jgi:hypothetical protein
MRFNPRQSAEELQDDSSVGREDSEERARHDAKKREDQDKRAKMMQGLQHMKIKIPQKDLEDEEDSPIKEQSELGQMTGQVGQSEANAGANPRASGMAGTNIMLSNNFIDEAFDLIRKKRDKPAFDTEKPKRTKTVEDVKQRRRGLKGGRRRKRGDVRVEDKKRKRAKKGSGRPLRSGAGRRPALASTFTSSRAPYTSFGTGYTYGQRTAPQRLPGFTGRSRAKRSYPDPRQREHEADLQQYRQNLPLLDTSPQTPTKTATQRLSTPIRGRGRKKPHSKAMRQPKQTDTPGGKIMSEATSLAGGGGGGIGSTDAILASEEFLHKRAQKVKLSISPRDRIEYRRLVDQLNHLMRRLMRKEDKSMQGATDGPSPNSSGGLTSSPTGATETDPEDDATTWGAHAYDLYTRRGGIA